MTILKREISKLLDLGVFVPSDSESVLPVHLVPKKGNEYRITGDFGLLKKQTKVDRYPFPFLTDFVDVMAGSTVFSSLVSYKSCYQLELAPSGVQKNAICHANRPFRIQTPCYSYEKLSSLCGKRNV